jgi:D-beta-D-heptose 7-phosphate kinase/D-beta-D-heptose 1-phosphate adenosyltransferase
MTIDFSKFSSRYVLVIGDLMIDEYVWGETDRISPEAPVQVVAVQQEECTLGGAGNVVNNLVALGASVSVIGAVGKETDGRRVLEILSHLNVDASGVVVDPERLTTRKTRVIAANQQVLRIDRETRKNISENILAVLKEAVDRAMPQSEVVLISDYAKGTVTSEFVKHIVATAEKYNKPIIADPAGRDFSKYTGVHLLTPNKKEAADASGIEISDEADLVRASEKLMNQAGVEQLLITCGSEGMAFFKGNEPPSYIKAEARQVFDVSGAGDTVLAVLGLALASGEDTRQAAELANTAAGLVVAKVGTATVSWRELESAVYAQQESVRRKERSIEDLRREIEKLRQRGKKIVMTNGCFDLLHAGHIHLFAESKRLGDVLIVAIDDDKSVTHLKGQGRPIISLNNRLRILSALDQVDFLVVFSTENLRSLIKTIRPDFLTKGSNYTEQEIVGKEIVFSYGGQVARIPVVENISTSRIIDSIKNG